MTYRSLSNLGANKPKRETPAPRGYFKKEEATYFTYIQHEALRQSLDYLWESLLSANVRTTGREDAEQWWSAAIDQKWLDANPRAEGWAIYYQAASEARGRLAGESQYVALDDKMQWLEEGSGKKIPILMEDVDNA